MLQSLTTRLDHLVVAAHTLDQGVAYIKDQLGVTIPYGGEHPKMGTHNCLARLGEEIFFEIIAINPDAAQPDHPRWFNLDDPEMQKRLKKQPQLLTWVVNTNDIALLAQKSAYSIGTPERITRGELSWMFGLTDDGKLLNDGILPHVIQWFGSNHPATKMEHTAFSLSSFTVFHNSHKWLKTTLGSIGVDHLIAIAPLQGGKSPYIEALFNTPLGERKLRSHIV